MRTYMSLFSSAGVGCYGFRGLFECIATNELIEERMNIQRANHKCKYESGYVCGDITHSDVQQRLFDQIALWEQNEGLQQVDIVIATPPCQGMSTANYKKKDSEQTRNSLVVEAVRIIDRIRPKIFIIENVRAFMKTACTDISGKDMPIGESIRNNLGANYHIHHKVINFKNYGVPSSRPRTLVIGTLKTLHNLSPLNLFPIRKPEITLKEAIGSHASLGYGQKDETDFLHFARKFPEYQLEWIRDLKEGESAFLNPPATRPYKLDKAGKRVELKGAFMGNKYRRLRWDRPCACIATRNDQLASQDTIHPTDHRVLSVRELMALMTIPSSFRWTTRDDEILPSDSEDYLRENELNIRRCIGEALPTEIVRDIALRAQTMLRFEEFVQAFDPERMKEYLSNKELCSNFYIDTFLKEQQIRNAKRKGAFYTPQCVVYDLLKTVRIEKDEIRILEPAVGLGAFIPQLGALFSQAKAVRIDAVEIDRKTIASLRESLKKIEIGSNIRIRFICADFLKLDTREHYDLVVTNPPYTAAKKTDYAPLCSDVHKTKNLFALFLIKLYGMADQIACVIPKNFIMADEFESIRKMYESLPIVSICDFGVKFFKKVFIEIITIHFSKSYSADTTVVDYVDGRTWTQRQGYLFHDRLWLLYRDAFFDQYVARLRLDYFSAFRDRQITNGKVSLQGKVWVLRSKNILDDGRIVHKAGYDRYVDSVAEFAVGRFLDSRAILMPNFTYNTRATLLPNGAVPNGSIAILIPPEGENVPDLPLYATDEFRRYYATVKSHSRFTLNIDKCALYYIGVPKKLLTHE